MKSSTLQLASRTRLSEYNLCVRRIRLDVLARAVEGPSSSVSSHPVIKFGTSEIVKDLRSCMTKREFIERNALRVDDHRRFVCVPMNVPVVFS